MLKEASKGVQLRDEKVYGYRMKDKAEDNSRSYECTLASDAWKPNAFYGEPKVYSYGTLLRKGDFFPLYAVHLSSIFSP